MSAFGRCCESTRRALGCEADRGQTQRRQGDEYRAGKTGLLGFFVGQGTRQSGGNANSAPVSQVVQERLGN
ncbi:hypothetical protein [Longimicrobium sp.]|uniref:hypothetical protein n=1 Tax=Longimicrobium sp. TaxID=2029185 RepID=UPI002E3001FD|nr:hypothetical protein [Longimicrobium sp.]HEX6039591.1 hypothetical protein [Longimicrobium sp.]